MSTADRLQPDNDAPAPWDEAPDKPEGPIVAAILAGGVGCLALGVFTTLSEASTSFTYEITLLYARPWRCASMIVRKTLMKY